MKAQENPRPQNPERQNEGYTPPKPMLPDEQKGYTPPKPSPEKTPTPSVTPSPPLKPKQ